MAYLGPWAWVATGSGTGLRIVSVPRVLERDQGPKLLGKEFQKLLVRPWAHGPWALGPKNVGNN